jgi:hypothetical protein
LKKINFQTSRGLLMYLRIERGGRSRRASSSIDVLFISEIL